MVDPEVVRRRVLARLHGGSSMELSLSHTQLAAPAGFADDDLGGDKRRWSVKTSFDFSDFAA